MCESAFWGHPPPRELHEPVCQPPITVPNPSTALPPLLPTLLPTAAGSLAWAGWLWLWLAGWAALPPAAAVAAAAPVHREVALAEFEAALGQRPTIGEGHVVFIGDSTMGWCAARWLRELERRPGLCFRPLL